MSYTKFSILGATALATIMAAPAFAQSAEDESTGGLAEIIVTAQKREQSVQDVPIAVTAVSQETLQANRITTVNDLSSIAPGLSVRPSSGGIQTPAFTIRGQTSYGVVAGSDKQVSIYLDGVYISSPRGSIFDLPDVARLEVLRGPQGTLFGRNATAGAVSVVTRDPTGEPSIKADFSYGNLNSRRFRLSADLPQIGPFSAYVSFLRNSRRGEIRNAAGGTTWDRSLSPDGIGVTRSPNFLGSVDSNSYFAAVKFEPSDTFKTIYKFDRNEDNGTPDGVAITGYDPTFASLGPAAPLFAPIFNALYATNNIYLNTTGGRPKIVTNGWSTTRKQRIFGHSMTSTWQVSDDITVKNVAAYRKAYVHAPSAIDGISHLTFTPQALVPYATFIAFSSIGRAPGINSQADAIAAIPSFAARFAPLVGSRYIFTASQATSTSKQWSDELQVNYSTDRLNLTVGGLWFKSDDTSGGPEGMQNTFSFGSPFIPASGVLPLGNEGRSLNKATSLAAYAQLEYKITSDLEIVAGGRVTKDKKSGTFRYNSIVNGVATPATTIAPPTYKKTKPNFLIGLNWTPNADTLVYGKYSTSFVSGGSAAGLEYDPEVAKSFELGLKADFLDRRLRTNLALFHVTYSDHQTPASPQSTEARDAVRANLSQIYPPSVVDQLVGPTSGGSLGTYVQPVGDVVAKGAELEVTAAPVDGVTLGGSISYTDVKAKNVDPIVLNAQFGEYNASANRPKWTASVYAMYETQPLVGDMTLMMRIDGTYRSKYLLTTTPNLTSGRGVRNIGVSNDPLISSPSHWKWNGRVALRNIDLGGVDAELAVWGRNITNTKHHNAVLFLVQGTAVNYDPARTYGLDVSIKF